MEKIVIGICTHYRNELLVKCLENINSITLPQNCSVTVVIVDNTGEAFAKDTVNAIKNNLNFGIYYSNVDGKIIAKVRNKMLENALALEPDYIALIDDDEYPTKDWLLNLYNLLTEQNADIVSGPVISKFTDENFEEKEVADYIRKNSIFNLHQTRQTGKFCCCCATNNVLIKASVLSETGIKFNEIFENMSGEDIDFFGKLYSLGYKILWCKEAQVIENVPPNRSCLKYIMKRNFNNGYLKIFAKKTNKNLKIKDIFTTLFNFVFLLILTPISIILGATIFVELLGKFHFALGTLVSIFKDKTFKFYTNIQVSE